MMPKLCSVYIGDTLLDVFGYDKSYPEVVKIHGTDINVTEMIHGLNWEKFEEAAWKETV
jgi:hypothetical protein